MIELLLDDPRWKWLPGMQWVYKANPHALYRVKGDEKFRRGRSWYGQTRLPVASDAATAGCLWSLVEESIHDEHGGYTLETCYNNGYGEYTSTLYDQTGEAKFESVGRCSGRCALVMLHWLWFPPSKEGKNANL